MTNDRKSAFPALSRRRLLRQAVATGAGLCALSAGGAGRLAFMGRALAADQPPIGTYPDCCSGSTVTIGATVPRTGAYAVQGEDELKGMELAVEHINEGHELIKKIAPKVTKGVLGKQVKLVVADSGAKPNQAVQEQQTFINDNKIALMTGSTSSAVAVALNKFAEREKLLYVTRLSIPARDRHSKQDPTAAAIGRPASAARGTGASAGNRAREPAIRGDCCCGPHRRAPARLRSGSAATGLPLAGLPQTTRRSWC